MFGCKQQILGRDIVHDIGITFKLARDISRRRRLGNEDTAEGSEGTWGFAMKPGCVRPKEGDGDCGAGSGDSSTPKDTDTTDAGEKSFALIASFLALFAI